MRFHTRLVRLVVFLAVLGLSLSVSGADWYRHASRHGDRSFGCRGRQRYGGGHHTGRTGKNDYYQSQRLL